MWIEALLSNFYMNTRFKHLLRPIREKDAHSDDLIDVIDEPIEGALVARHYPQHCGLGHLLQDEDVVQIVKKKEKEEGGRGRFKSHSNAPARISDREKKAPLKT
nr:developmentally-regulated G-protein 2 [Ipomoea batatas]